MDRITGNGRPTKHTKGEVGQWYEDLETGDIYECRIAHEYSAIHGYPVGGYVWELRATGEDMSEIYGGSIPKGGEPHKQLVTDGNGVAKWDDRLAYAKKSGDFNGSPTSIAFTANENGVASVMGFQYQDAIMPNTLYALKADGKIYTATSSEECDGTFPDCPVTPVNNPVRKGRWAEFVDENGAPYCVIVYSYPSGMAPCLECHNVSANSAITIELGEAMEVETITPIDPKFIILTSPNGTKYNLAVADDGTLSATAVTE